MWGTIIWDFLLTESNKENVRMLWHLCSCLTQHWNCVRAWWPSPGKLTYVESEQSWRWSGGIKVLSSWKHWLLSVTLTAPEPLVQRFGRLAVDSPVGSVQVAHPPKLLTFGIWNSTLLASRPARQNDRTREEEEEKPANPQRARRWPHVWERKEEEEPRCCIVFTPQASLIRLLLRQVADGEEQTN